MRDMERYDPGSVRADAEWVKARYGVPYALLIALGCWALCLARRSLPWQAGKKGGGRSISLQSARIPLRSSPAAAPASSVGGQRRPP